MHIIFHKSFIKEYKKLQTEIQNKFDERLRFFRDGTNLSILNTHSLQGKHRGYKSLNVNGDIRAIYKEEYKVIIFVSIGSHSELYG
jgi:addiction module RelE/StbE family toxin